MELENIIYICRTFSCFYSFYSWISKFYVYYDWCFNHLFFSKRYSIEIMEVINLFLYNPTYIIVFIVALLFYLFKPKKINSLYGYRTKKSMKDKESWDFSQKYSSKIFLSFSILLLILH